MSSISKHLIYLIQIYILLQGLSKSTAQGQQQYCTQVNNTIDYESASYHCYYQNPCGGSSYTYPSDFLYAKPCGIQPRPDCTALPSQYQDCRQVIQVLDPTPEPCWDLQCCDAAFNASCAAEGPRFACILRRPDMPKCEPLCPLGSWYNISLADCQLYPNESPPPSPPAPPAPPPLPPSPPPSPASPPPVATPPSPRPPFPPVPNAPTTPPSPVWVPIVLAPLPPFPPSPPGPPAPSPPVVVTPPPPPPPPPKDGRYWAFQPAAPAPRPRTEDGTVVPSPTTIKPSPSPAPPQTQSPYTNAPPTVISLDPVEDRIASKVPVIVGVTVAGTITIMALTGWYLHRRAKARQGQWQAFDSMLPPGYVPRYPPGYGPPGGNQAVRSSSAYMPRSSMLASEADARTSMLRSQPSASGRTASPSTSQVRGLNSLPIPAQPPGNPRSGVTSPRPVGEGNATLTPGLIPRGDGSGGGIRARAGEYEQMSGPLRRRTTSPAPGRTSSTQAGTSPQDHPDGSPNPRVTLSRQDKRQQQQQQPGKKGKGRTSYMTHTNVVYEEDR